MGLYLASGIAIHPLSTLRYLLLQTVLQYITTILFGLQKMAIRHYLTMATMVACVCGCPARWHELYYWEKYNVWSDECSTEFCSLYNSVSLADCAEVSFTSHYTCSADSVKAGSRQFNTSLDKPTANAIRFK